jgi:hypothetical protein
MTDHESDPMADLGHQLGAGLRQLQATMAEAAQQPRFHYIRVTWGEVNSWAAHGYQLAAIPSHFDAESSHRWYIMGRPLGPADEAAAMLSESAPMDQGPAQ